jgi:hypothetical protein
MNKNKSAAPREVGGIDAWEVPGLIGAELALHVAPALELFERLKVAGCVTPAESDAIEEAAGHLQRIAFTSQQITRLASGRLRQSHEQLDLAEVIRHVLAENQRGYERRAIEVEHRLQSIAVVTDPGLLVTLCEVALECAAWDGERVQLWLGMKHWPENALLTIRARPHFRESASQDASHSLSWIYLCRLAAVSGVTVQREVEAEFVQITLEFPRTVKQLAGLTAMEVETGAEPSDLSSLAGHHVLLVTGDAQVIWEVDAVARQMRLVLDVVKDCEAAVRFCELELPDMIIIDEAAHNALFDELRDDVLRQNINFPCLEVVRADNVVEIGTWHNAASSRVSRSELRNQLQLLLTMELAKVF